MKKAKKANYSLVSNLRKYQPSWILLLLGLLLIGLGVAASRTNLPDQEPKFISAEEDGNKEGIKVFISGAVEKPGVYSLDPNSRLVDLLEKALLADNADKNWVSKNLNLAAKLNDAEKIYIPRKGENLSSTTDTSGTKININGASSEILDTLPGIGEKTASKIIQNRPYSSVEDLRTKKVVGEATFEKIKAQITVN